MTVSKRKERKRKVEGSGEIIIAHEPKNFAGQSEDHAHPATSRLLGPEARTSIMPGQRKVLGLIIEDIQ